jgi:hypothetical protein
VARSWIIGFNSVKPLDRFDTVLDLLYWSNCQIRECLRCESETRPGTAKKTSPISDASMPKPALRLCCGLHCNFEQSRSGFHLYRVGQAPLVSDAGSTWASYQI